MKKCSTGGTSASHNYEECKKDYHFNRTTKNCINTKPNSTYIDNSEMFGRKLAECGTIVIKNNAIKTCNKFFN